MTNSPEAYFLDQDVWVFNASSFHISPAEAAAMDPQQRLLLETVHESIERAGRRVEQLEGSSTGVYFAHGGHQCPTPSLSPLRDTTTVVANRICYFFDWRGPSFTVDTACSSGLTALYLAVEALRNRECTLAGSHMQILSPQGRSHMWDARVDGCARGEGTASVVLKLLNDAMAAGDPVECVILPDDSQRELIRSTYARAGLDPTRVEDRCQYFDAHGTGTPVGDPPEASAIASAFFSPESPAEDVICAGSIKMLTGHTEATAGLAGVVKASLAIQHGIIPPNLLFQQFSPGVAQHASHLRVPTQALPWPDLPSNTPRRVSINLFGFDGANAHAVLECFSQAGSGAADSGVQTLSSGILPLAFSAASEESLEAQPSTITRRRQIGAQSVLAVFPGQGAQWPQMGLDVISTCTHAASWLQELLDSFETLPAQDWPKFTLLDELSAPEVISRLHSAAFSLPIRTALQIIQIRILRSLGIEFAAVVGHSSGEIGAAYGAGQLTALDAIRIAYLREVPASHAGCQGQSGAMLAFGISWDQAQAICSEAPYSGWVVVAASNSPTSLEWLFESLEQSPRRLRVDTAYHSHHMAPCADPYL
ncbi:thiolase-like protein [Aspergillus heteromorphus CBS 117.55]|uniref:Thiolase-like protein n=1 Tax=Aspergillus heteromorphus CBS 117.55 TaxID=1448321 RepID=A0A317WLQ6_9EURO|nr:thiolase-like protein [Aspergillus heteromorphus CBS 117.55]PWY85948.1 thiolase-like protein [Aspergillus heteromorphus CBS 117.55]